MVILKKFVTKQDFFFQIHFLKGSFFVMKLAQAAYLGCGTLWHYFLKKLRRGQLWHHFAILVGKNSVSCLFTLTFLFFDVEDLMVVDVFRWICIVVVLLVFFVKLKYRLIQMASSSALSCQFVLCDIHSELKNHCTEEIRIFFGKNF